MSPRVTRVARLVEVPAIIVLSGLVLAVGAFFAAL